MTDDNIFLEAGRVLALLAKPMTIDEVREFAIRVVDRAAALNVDGENRLLALSGMIQPELTARGALHHHIVLVASAALHAADHVGRGCTLLRAREILGSVWAGVLIVEH